MKIADVKEAVSEAERFIARAKGFLESDEHNHGTVYGGRHCAAMKRSSLDLSNALVRVRRTNWEG